MGGRVQTRQFQGESNSNPFVAQPVDRSLYPLSYPNSVLEQNLEIPSYEDTKFNTVFTNDPTLGSILNRFDSLHTFTSYL